VLRNNENRINDELAEGLRQKAEKMLSDIGQRKTLVADDDMQALFQELQIHQLELEMQNDELKVANEQLELQQLKFSGIYNLAPLGYFILNSFGVIEEVNNAGAHLIEGGKAGLMGKRLTQFILPEFTDVFYQFFKDMQATHSKQSCQLQMRSGTGVAFDAQVEGRAIRPQINAPTQYYIAVVDISERIEAEKSLAATKERLELSLEASSAGTWELELETMKFYLDEFNYHICTIPEGGFDGRYHSFLDLIHPEDRLGIDEAFRKSINYEKEMDAVCRLINTQGKTCYAGIRGHLINGPAQTKRLVGIMIDITEKKSNDEEKMQLKQEQQKAVVLAALNAEVNERQRISDALHDSVSQLLYGIKMKLGTLNLSHSKAHMDISELIDQAIQETRNISFELAPSILLDFGLPATIEELVKRLSTPGMQIQAKVTGFATRQGVLLETSIFRIIQELINNCMKHANARHVTIHLKKSKYIQIEVKDDGDGFDHKASESATGGSGLRSIKNRISLYNGELEVNSTPGQGTCVKVLLHPNT
jgi:PAS domain S-box-containing protein